MCAFERAVCYDNAPNAVLVKMACCQLDCFTGTNQQCGLLRQVAEYLSGKAYCGKCDGDRAVADCGIGTYLFGDGKGVLKQLSQQLARSGSVGSGLVGLFYLAENLWLAQHHRVQAAGNPQQVGDGIAVPVVIYIR